MPDPTDRARPVREGETFDVEKVAAFLRQNIEGAEGPLTVEQFPSGHSNLTYLLRVPGPDGGRELVLRRPPFGSKVKSAHDMGREFRILSKLHAVYDKAPRPLAYCDDESVLGAPFYVMERLRGIILRRKVPDGLTLDLETTRKMGLAVVDGLVELHALDYAAAGLAELGKPEGYVERQVTGWTKRYEGSKTDDIPHIDQIAKWLAERMTDVGKKSRAALIHNDWKYDNLVLDANDPTRIRGVLDWEMSTIGDPLMDLGTAIGYWVEVDDDDAIKSFAFGPTSLPGSLKRDEVVARYGEKSGRDVSDMLFYYCFAHFKLAVVAQQIYYRYAQGLTKDERFAMMIAGVRVLADEAVRAAEAGSFRPHPR